MRRALLLLVLALSFALPFRALAARSQGGGGYSGSVDSCPIAAAVFTQSIWFRSADVVTGVQILCGIVNQAGADNIAHMGIVASNLATSCSTDGVASGGATVAVTLTNNTWYHGCYTSTSTTSRATYLNGGNKATDTTSIAAPTGATRVNLGAFRPAVDLYPLNGVIALGAFWSSALGDEEVAGLGAGRSALCVGRGALVFLCALDGDHTSEQDLVGQLVLTTSASTKAERPPMRFGGRRY